MHIPRRRRGVTGERDCYEEVVGPQGGKGGPCRIREEMTAQKGDIWGGGLALGREASKEILVCNSKLRTVDRPIEGLPSDRCPVIPCSGEPGGMAGVKVAKHHQVSTVLQKGIKVGNVVPGAEGRRGIYTLTVNVVPPRSVSTAGSSAVSCSGNLSPSGTL